MRSLTLHETHHRSELMALSQRLPPPHFTARLLVLLEQLRRPEGVCRRRRIVQNPVGVLWRRIVWAEVDILVDPIRFLRHHVVHFMDDGQIISL